MSLKWMFVKLSSKFVSSSWKQVEFEIDEFETDVSETELEMDERGPSGMSSNKNVFEMDVKSGSKWMKSLNNSDIFQQLPLGE